MASLAASAAGLQAVKAPMGVLQYAKVSGLALLLFDYCITFPLEVKWTWGRRWDLTQITFLLSRYLPFVAATLATYPFLVVDHHDVRGLLFALLRYSDARAVFRSWMGNSHILSSDGLLLLRTYAFWLRNKLILAFLLVTAIVFVVVAEVLVVHLNKTLDTAIRRASAIQYGFLVAYEIIRNRKHHSDSRSSLVRALVVGAAKYIYVLCASAVNILVLAFAHPSYSELMFNVQLALHSAMSSRILFDLHTTQEKRLSTLIELTRRPRSGIIIHVEHSSHVTGPDDAKHADGRRLGVPSCV
ncbi:hypothetical protein CONPUDRAFT_159812 [Coniophora puteana RWD-64-598 SS2]|uniref:DUF6533 domain-containing protein n=1 Tax=Coniophora puteana (strain RWD-64-598) TaxID=741705 RepID=R7SEA5_CONPW|nr:uncharacterized protein CONPUDRAFT_159812 [Coniophora puteana RWD-64-598 SS2]EIW74511.1 hypothetical protein CONPUDRAFT_159812 [Coniophora puteana RWD-64-598 SS2]